MSELKRQAASAREAALKMQAVSTEVKNSALRRAAALLRAKRRSTFWSRTGWTSRTPAKRA